MHIVVAAVCAYLLGSVPFGLIVSRLGAGKDLRDYGSGKTGFTNSLRVLGLRRSLPVLAGDLSKGIAAALLPLLYTDDPWARAIAALTAVVGHAWPLFAGFRGGRGVLTGAGAMLALNPLAVLPVLPVAVGAAVATRIMSVVSISSAACLAVSFMAFAAGGLSPWPYAWAALTGSLLVIALHRDNIARLLAGTEPRIGRGGERRAAG